MLSYEVELEFARELAWEAHAVLMEIYEEAGSDEGLLRIEQKAAGAGPVTLADQALNDLIVSRIRAAFPQDGILAEESADDGGRLEAGRFWCIDPLDGTKEFIKRNGEFSIMIGLVDRRADSRPVLGVVVEPVQGQIMSAALGQGAFVEARGGVRRRLQVSSRDEGSSLRFIVSRSHPDPEITEAGRRLSVESVTPCGSVGIKLGRIAQDRADVYLNFGGKTSFWDTCAPEAIFSEAGGRLTTLDGALIDYMAKSAHIRAPLVATNGACHALVLQTCQAIAAGRS